MVEAEWQRVARHGAGVRRGRGRAHPGVLHAAAATSRCTTRTCCRAGRPNFATGISATRKRHKVAGYRAVFVSLKSPTRPPGDITDDGDGSRRRSGRSVFARPRSARRTIRICCSPMCASATCSRCGRRSKAIDLATPNIGTLTDMICCPGLDFCSLANATLDSDREADQRALRRSRLSVRPRRHPAEDVGLHERLRPSLGRPHRHPRRR